MNKGVRVKSQSPNIKEDWCAGQEEIQRIEQSKRENVCGCKAVEIPGIIQIVW